MMRETRTVGWMAFCLCAFLGPGVAQDVAGADPQKAQSAAGAGDASSQEPAFQGKTATQWMGDLRDDKLWIYATADLLKAGKEGIPVFQFFLKQEDPSIRTVGAMGLTKVGPEAKVALPGLIEAMKSDYLNLKYWAAETLANIGPDAAAAVPFLAEAVKTYEDTSPNMVGPSRYFRDLRWAAAHALGEIGPAAKSAIPALEAVESHQGEDKEVKQLASEAIVKIRRR